MELKFNPRPSGQYRVPIENMVRISPSYFAGITCMIEDENFKKYTYRLHIIRNDLSQIKTEIALNSIRPESLMRLSDDYIAVIGHRSFSDTNWVIKIYNLDGKKINTIIVEKSNENPFYAVTTKGQIAICNTEGKISLYDTLKLKFQKALIHYIPPKDLVNIITDYVGFYSKNCKSPFMEITPPKTKAECLNDLYKNVVNKFITKR